MEYGILATTFLAAFLERPDSEIPEPSPNPQPVVTDEYFLPFFALSVVCLCAPCCLCCACNIGMSAVGCDDLRERVAVARPTLYVLLGYDFVDMIRAIVALNLSDAYDGLVTDLSVVSLVMDVLGIVMTALAGATGDLNCEG